jgi:hypothetical protein
MMTDERMQRLEGRLLDLGTAIAFPTTPALSEAVAERFASHGAASAGRPLSRGMALRSRPPLLVGVAAAFASASAACG